MFRISLVRHGVLRFLALLACLALACSGLLAAGLPSVALIYAKDAPLDELKAFDIAVVDPDHGFDPASYRAVQRTEAGADAASELFAYVSLGEVHPSRAWASRVPAGWRLGENTAWSSHLIDQARPEWTEFFTETVVAPLWARGYRGLFIDTMDSYRLASGADLAAQQAGIVRTLRHLRQRFPGIRLILNRGFEFLPELRGEIHAIAAESLYQGWSPVSRSYRQVPEADREWLRTQLRQARDEFGLPAIAIDYVAPHDRALARETAGRILAEGFIPWVADPDLATLGVGSIEVLPRRILLIHNGKEAARVNVSSPHRFLEMPLNHLGYVLDYVDVNGPLPARTDGRYAGVVTWFDGAVEPRPRQVLAAWLAARIEEGVRVAVIGDRGHLKTQPLAMITGLRAAPQPRGSLRISHRSKEVGLELEPIPSPPPNPLVIDAPDFTPWLSLTDTAGRRYDEVFIAPWGGVMPGRYGVMEMPGGLDQFRWVTDPFAFLTAALALPSLPVPDTTTENGRRLLFAHVDGDAFPSRAEMPGKLLAAEVLQRDILERYRIPHAMSVIEAEVAPHGLYPRESAEMEGVARRMFALPHVEIASHSYTHPFYWEDTAAGKVSVAAQGYTLAPQDYVPSLEREILGSAGYIRQRLAPREKPVSLMLWTGNAAPTGRALEVAEQGGMLNLNGGNTIITRAYPSLTAISPLGVRHPQGFHVYAPIMNENVFTNLWTGPYYGFERVIETFQMTGSPRRIKPIDIYYHTYSASKPASLRALHKVYGWAMAQPVHPVFPSEFVRKAMNFNSVVLARPVGGDALLVRNAVHLRTLRAPAGLGVPDMAASRGLAGWRAGEEGRYLHLADSRAEIRFAPAANRLPMLHSANARLSRWKAVDKGLQFRLQGHQALELELVHPPQCLLSSAGKTLPGSSRDKQHFLYRTSHAAADFDLRCP